MKYFDIVFFFQFDQSDLLLPSAEYYQLGFNHPIIQSYYNVLLNVATLLGAEPALAKKEMKELIEFEMNLASVSIKQKSFRNFLNAFTKFLLKECENKCSYFPHNKLEFAPVWKTNWFHEKVEYQNFFLNFHMCPTWCGHFTIFLLLRFCVKSILENVEVLKVPFLPF